MELAHENDAAVVASAETVENSGMAQFMAEINAADGLSCRSYSGFHAFSICETEVFWAKAWDFPGVIGKRGDEPHLEPRRKFAPQEASV